jgi:hypothetical protein
MHGGVYRVLMAKPEGRRPMGRPRHRWVGIKMNILEVGCGGMDWIELAQDRDMVGSCECGKKLQVHNVGKFLTSCKPVSFSRRTVLLLFYVICDGM